MAWIWIGGTVGDWYENPDGTWRHDPDAPSPGRNPALTQILPVVAASPDVDPDLMPPEDEHQHGGDE